MWTTIIAIFVCFVASLVNYFYNKNNPLYLKVFPLFLLFVMTIEYFAVRLAMKRINNLFLYDINTAAEFLFYLFFFYSIYKNSRARKTALVLMFVYLACAIVNIFFIQGTRYFHTYTFMAGCLFVIGGSIYYFFQLFRYPQTGNIMREPAFWIASALLFYYVCVMPVYGILNYLSSITRQLNQTLQFVIYFMNILLYGLFTLAFLCRLSIRKYTS